MITIRLAQDRQGVIHASAEAGGKTFRAAARHGAARNLIRMLIDADVPDQPWEAFPPTGNARMYGQSIRKWANTHFQRTGDAPDGFSS